MTETKLPLKSFVEKEIREIFDKIHKIIKTTGELQSEQVTNIINEEVEALNLTGISKYMVQSNVLIDIIQAYDPTNSFARALEEHCKAVEPSIMLALEEIRRIKSDLFRQMKERIKDTSLEIDEFQRCAIWYDRVAFVQTILVLTEDTQNLWPYDKWYDKWKEDLSNGGK